MLQIKIVCQEIAESGICWRLLKTRKAAIAWRPESGSMPKNAMHRFLAVRYRLPTTLEPIQREIGTTLFKKSNEPVNA